MSHIYIKENSLKNVISKLVSPFGPPKIIETLSMFSEENKKRLKISIQESQIFIHFNSGKPGKDTKSINLSENTLRNVYELVNNLGFKKFIINSIYVLDFGSFKLNLKTFKGDFIECEEDKLKEIMNLLDENEYVLEKTDDIVHDLEDFCDSNFGLINTKITNFCRRNGIGLSNNNTLKELIESSTNDYTNIENLYKLVTGGELLNKVPYKNFVFGFEGVSIIIPSYNSKSTLEKVLLAIDSQDLSHEFMDKIEVIIIDDGSFEYEFSEIEKYQWKFKLMKFKSFNNIGRSKARNVGISIASKDTVIFLDSDVLIDKNYIYEMYLRTKVIGNAVFVSFKSCLDKNDPKIKKENIKKGLKKPSDFSGDWRVSAFVDKGKPGMVDVLEGKITNILGDTDYFKDFGHGRYIGVFDLSATVATHNIALSKKTLKGTNLFSTEFAGWGLEDTLLGSELISKGNFVIPVLSTGIYHIDHPPRSGDNEAKKMEFLKNLSIYKEKIYEKRIRDLT